jgi:hypothetical protein
VDKDIDEREEAMPKHAKEKKSKRKWFWAPYLKGFCCIWDQYTDTLVPDSSFVQNNVTYAVVMNDSLRSVWNEFKVRVLLQHL